MPWFNWALGQELGIEESTVASSRCASMEVWATNAARLNFLERPMTNGDLFRINRGFLMVHGNYVTMAVGSEWGYQLYINVYPSATNTYKAMMLCGYDRGIYATGCFFKTPTWYHQYNENMHSQTTTNHGAEGVNQSSVLHPVDAGKPVSR